MLPKPGKTDYNVTKSYRPISLESVIRKIMERVICNRLIWKLEVDGGIADTQFAYRQQKSCVQTMLRVCIPYQRREAGKSILLLRLWIMRAATKEFGGQAC